MDQSFRLCSIGSWVAGISLGLLTLSAATAHAAAEGERCGRFGSWSASCDEGLECDVRWNFWRWQVGVCVPVETETACGARLGDTCADDEFCSFTPEAICGFADAAGVCAPRPEACTEQYDPVCGCDNQTYGNDCEANAAGVSVQYTGVCSSECTSDADCPYGICDQGVTCAAVGCPPPPPNRCTVCGDGSMLLCRRAQPVCPDGLVPEIVNSCFGACVDRVTCEPAVTCEYGGQIYRPGDGFKSTDGCNDCGCSDDGTVFCTLRLCVCDYEDPARRWVSRDPEECTRIDFQCAEGEEQFTDAACGCGCAL